MSHILAGGREVTCAAPVVLWGESGLHFTALGRRSQTTAIVLHWTGGANLGPGVFETLRTRTDPKTGKVLGLSVHFAINPDGTVYQFCDADMRCAHAGSVDDQDHDGAKCSGNATTIGIEMVNPAGPSDPTGLRPVVTETIHGRRITHTGFTAPQIASARALCRSLCLAYGLPSTLPMRDGKVIAGVMDEAAWKAFRGICGHLHLTERKTDPGLAIFDAFTADVR